MTLPAKYTHNQVKIGRCTNKTLTPTDTELIRIDNVNEAVVTGDILTAILVLDATCRDPGKVTCDQAQRPSTGSLQRITGNGQHDGGMGAAQREEDQKEERCQRLGGKEWEPVLVPTYNGGKGEEGARILLPVPTHVDQPTGRIDESLKMARS